MPRGVGHKRQGSIDFLQSFGVVNEKITATASASPVQPRLTYDYVLVAKASDEQDKLRTAKQRDFIAALKAKKLKIHTVENAEKVFYCITAPTEIFETYKYLLKLSDVYNWSCEQQDAFPHSNRIRIVDFILQHTSTLSDEYLPDLVKKNVFETHFCLHEKREQKELKKRWARWSACFKGQPISNVRNYLGEKVAFYFLWLGWYTFLLIPAAVIGMVVFLYGLRFYSTSPLIKEVCQSNATMCPMCDNKCKVWKLADTCAYAKLSLLFDNEGTVAFAMFMAVWATVFLEFWKRHRSSYVCEWKVFDWCEEEEERILDIVNNPDCESKAHSYSYLRSTAVFVLGTLMLLVIIGLTYVLVVFRVIATVLLAEYSPWHLLSENSHTAALILGAVFHYVIITVMTRVNCKVSMKLSEIENKHSRTAIERSFTVKMFTFQFFTLFSTLIYTAFFLGRVNGHPGGYARIFGRWRLEECHPSGCLTDLFIQLSIIMILKQMFNNIFEYSGPWFSGWVKRTKSKKLKKQFDGSSTSKRAQETKEILICDDELLTNYNMKTTDRFSLFNEFLEMVIQFSFTTIFVAAFPLAPLLALLNNIVEIRLDAIKMVRLERRLVPAKANDIGVWTDVLEAIGVLAVIANGLVIGISSDFIPRLVYKYYYGPCASSNATDVDCMAGYISNTLSVANTSDQRVRLDFTEDQMVTYDGVRVSHCSYRDYRSRVDFSLTNQFWVNLAARLAFIILFEHIVVACKSIAGWFVPNSPLDVKNGRMCDQLKRLKEELRAQKAQHKSSALNEQNGLSGKKEELQMKQNTL